MDKQMLYIQVDCLRIILEDLMKVERPRVFIAKDLRETIERIIKLLDENDECNN